MKAEALRLKSFVDDEHKAQYFEFVEYPCRALAAMAGKMLTAQLARHGKANWAEAVKGHDDIFKLRDEYHSLLDGKWNNMAGFWIGHSIYRAVDTTQHSRPVESKVLYKISAKDGQYGKNSYIIPGLGYSQEALSIAQEDSFTVIIPATADSLCLTVTFVPNHPVSGDRLEALALINGKLVQRLRYDTKGRSEEWKQNVESNQARRTFTVPLSAKPRVFSIIAMTQGVVLDEVKVESVVSKKRI